MHLLHFRHRASVVCFLSFFFNDTATTEIYTLSLHDALPIFLLPRGVDGRAAGKLWRDLDQRLGDRSEEHTSELQSHSDLVCRLLLEKKKKNAKQRLRSPYLDRTQKSDSASMVAMLHGLRDAG